MKKNINPLKNPWSSYPDQIDEDGGFKTGEQVFREMEKLHKDRIAKDNNLIEVYLVK